MCGGNFLYAVTLATVASTQLNRGEWPLGSWACRLHYTVESTGKYASIIFTALLFTESLPTWIICAVGWGVCLAGSSLLCIFASVETLRSPESAATRKICLVKWPSFVFAKWYVVGSATVLYALPMTLTVYCYVGILRQLRTAAQPKTHEHYVYAATEVVEVPEVEDPRHPDHNHTDRILVSVHKVTR
ncbi:CRE-NPR-16 protein [Aphelenchoides avenae]|nr:CRE-NPR-16 protein [Aphelenchus avenae]